MNTEQRFNILFRKPSYPVIVISGQELLIANNIKQLAKCCIKAEQEVDQDLKIIKAFDTTGTEFWYSIGNYAISPGFSAKKWSKKKIIELYNQAENSTETYSEKSLSSKKLDVIIKEISELINKS